MRDLSCQYWLERQPMDQYPNPSSLIFQKPWPVTMLIVCTLSGCWIALEKDTGSIHGTPKKYSQIDIPATRIPQYISAWYLCNSYLALLNPLRATCFDLVDKATHAIVFTKPGNTIAQVCRELNQVKMHLVQIWMQYGKMYLIPDLINIEYLLWI